MDQHIIYTNMMKVFLLSAVAVLPSSALPEKRILYKL